MSVSAPGVLELPRSLLPYRAVDSDAMDCVDDNVATLLLARGATEVRASFAREWHFGFDAGQGTATLRRSTLAELVRRSTGHALEAKPFELVGGAQVSAKLDTDGPFILFGDAYFMPWLPYFGEDHNEHSFIVDACCEGHVRVVDAYQNKTEWGSAQPSEVWLPCAALPKMMSSLGSALRFVAWSLASDCHLPSEAARETLLMNAAESEGIARGIQKFGEFYRERHRDPALAQQLVLQCWLVLRSRMLHSRWLADLTVQHGDTLPRDFAAAFQAQVVRPWQRVAEFAYLLWRRVRQGKPAPLTCFDLLDQEVWGAERSLARDLGEYLARPASR